jgi:DnaJ-class molecular chaperone
MYHTEGGEKRTDARGADAALYRRRESAHIERREYLMQDEDLYSILGVAKGTTEAEIKKTYRKLARELHPDKNKGNKEAEERFKKVSAAYAVLGNAGKRKLYDAYGIDGLRDGFDPKMWERARGGAGGGGRRARQYGEPVDFGGFTGFGGMEDIFEALFGGGGGGARQGGQRRREWGAHVGVRGPDVQSQMEVGLLDAVLGRELQIIVPIGGERRSLKVRLPKGIESGQSIRLKGQGGKGGGGDGDLIVEISIKEDERYTRRGSDLVKREDVTVGKAYFGGPLEVETPWGKGKVNIPPGTRGGKRIRIKGHGVRTGDCTGDLYVEINIVLPEGRGEAVDGAVRELERLYGKG